MNHSIIRDYYRKKPVQYTPEELAEVERKRDQYAADVRSRHRSRLSTSKQNLFELTLLKIQEIQNIDTIHLMAKEAIDRNLNG